MSNITFTGTSYDYITAIAVSDTPANRVYYGTMYGKVFRLNNANTGNPTPTDIWSGSGFPDSAFVSCIAVDPSNTDNVIVVFSNYHVHEAR